MPWAVSDSSAHFFFFVSISLETQERNSPNALALMVLAAVYVLPMTALGKSGKQKRSPRHLPPSLLAALVSGCMSFLDVSFHTGSGAPQLILGCEVCMSSSF